MSAIKPVKAPWDGVALICKKCGKKLGGGFGAKGGEALSKALRAELKATGRRRALRVVSVGCLGLCPKRAVSVVASCAPGHVLSVPAGTDMGEVVQALLGG